MKANLQTALIMLCELLCALWIVLGMPYLILLIGYVWGAP